MDRGPELRGKDEKCPGRTGSKVQLNELIQRGQREDGFVETRSHTKHLSA